jgi:hypothetical protein
VADAKQEKGEGGGEDPEAAAIAEIEAALTGAGPG